MQKSSRFAKKLILCASVAGILGVTIKLATANEPTTHPSITAASDVDRHIHRVYSQLDMSGGEKISFDAFANAYRGYLNLRNAGKLNNNKPILTIADFSLSSTQKRLWLIDVRNKKVLMNEYVAHGQGSGSEFAADFSNTENSHQSSLGFYVTDNTYVGKHGTSLRLHGMDNGYNSAAYERAIVVHGADYVSPSFIAEQGRLGRSWGCPAVSRQAIGKVIDYIQGGTCLFIYAPQKEYLAGSSWLNKKIERLPEDHMIGDMIDPTFLAKHEIKTVRYEYAANAQDLNPESPLFLSAGEREKKARLLALNLHFVERLLP